MDFWLSLLDLICTFAHRVSLPKNAINFTRQEKLITGLSKNTVTAAKDLGVIGLEQLSINGSTVNCKSFCVKNSSIIIDPAFGRLILEIRIFFPMAFKNTS